MNKVTLAAAVAALSISYGASATENSLATINVGDNAPIIKVNDLKMYEELDIEKLEGIKRHVIALSPLENEYEAKVELRIKKTTEADCNVRNLATNIVEKTVKGWGYNYHVANVQGVQSTMMLCHEAPVEKTLYSTPQKLLRYNSKLPLVVYTLNDIELEVRVWTPSTTYQ